MSDEKIDHALRIAREEGGKLIHPKLRAPGVYRTRRAMGHTTRTQAHTGPIHSSVAGRTDHLPMHVPSGSYVIPADIVSGMGEGNTMAGFQHLKRVFGGTPYGAGASPYGQSGGPYGSDLKTGGSADDEHGADVPIVAAGGEHVLSPDQVRMAGDGDLDLGHEVLDEFVKRMRKELVKTLSKLPGPKKD